MGYSSRVQCSLVPSPTPSFWLLAVRTSLAVGQATKSWAWDRNEATSNLKLQLQDRHDASMNDNCLHRRPHPQLPLLAAPRRPGFQAYDHSENDYWHEVQYVSLSGEPHNMPCILLVIQSHTFHRFMQYCMKPYKMKVPRCALICLVSCIIPSNTIVMLQ